VFYYKFNISDWALHTAHLTLIEEAVYFRLINHYYDSESIIPLETQPIFRRLRLGSDVEIAEQILNEFFVKTDEGFLHNRCDKVLKEYRKTAKKNKVNGAKGGRPKKDAGSSISQDKPSGLTVETQVEPKHNPNYKLITTNQELETINQSNKDIGDKSPAKAKRFVEPSLIDVQNYFLDKTKDREQSGIEGMKFHAYYESNGWKVGKNKMKSWQSAAIGWIARNITQGNTNETNRGLTTDRPDRSAAGRVRQNVAKGIAADRAALAEIRRNQATVATDVIDVRPQMDILIR
jgi:uncharacterized protein YdaU (DUF1376 family)